MSRKRFFTGVGYVEVHWLILPCITLYYPGSIRVFFGYKAAITAIEINYLRNNVLNVYTVSRRAGFDEWLFSSRSQLRHENAKKKTLAPRVTLYDPY